MIGDGPLELSDVKLESLLKRANHQIQFLKTRVAALELDVTLLEAESKEQEPAPKQQPRRDNGHALPV